MRVAALEALLERLEAVEAEPTAIDAMTGPREARREAAGTERAGRVLPLPGSVTGVRERIEAETADDGAEATGATLALGGGDSPGARAGATRRSVPPPPCRRRFTPRAVTIARLGARRW